MEVKHPAPESAMAEFHRFCAHRCTLCGEPWEPGPHEGHLTTCPAYSKASWETWTATTEHGWPAEVERIYEEAFGTEAAG